MYSRLNPARIDREDEKRMLPCRYFLTGFCHKGNRCKFYHPNVHTRDPVIRPSEMPADFSIPHHMHQYNQFIQSHGIPSLMEMTGTRASSSRSRIFNTAQNSPITHGGSCSPRASSTGIKNFMSPPSQSYAEYLSYSQQQRNNPKDQDHPSEPKRVLNEEPKTNNQHTVFNHIDWSEFLAPGVCPPPPTQVPHQVTAISPDRLSDSGIGLSIWQPCNMEPGKNGKTLKPVLKVHLVNKEDIPPEGSQVGLTEEGEDQSVPVISLMPKKLSAKEELQLKVKQIAQELADEPVQHVRSLDSFFRNFKFNGFASPNNPATAMSKIEVGEPGDKNKENQFELQLEKGKGDESVESEAKAPPVRNSSGPDGYDTLENINRDTSIRKGGSPPI